MFLFAFLAIHWPECCRIQDRANLVSLSVTLKVRFFQYISFLTTIHILHFSINDPFALIFWHFQYNCNLLSTPYSSIHLHLLKKTFYGRYYYFKKVSLIGKLQPLILFWVTFTPKRNFKLKKRDEKSLLPGEETWDKLVFPVSLTTVGESWLVQHFRRHCQHPLQQQQQWCQLFCKNIT